jgi:sec-independent protein translocase protein TatB
MFGIGFTELFVVLIVALIVIGPDKLPAVAKTLGKTFVELKRAGEDIKKTVTELDLDGSKTPPAGKKRSVSKKGPVKAGTDHEEEAAPVPKPRKKVT